MRYIYIYICCYIVIVLDIEFITTNVLIDTHVVIFRRGVTSGRITLVHPAFR